jgi:lipopolysaccharide biosynthesis regulator YciM
LDLVLDLLSFDYRDPIYGVILLFILVFIISITNYWWGIFKVKEDESSINKFVKKFDQYDSFNDYKKLLQKKDLPVESAILMSLSYEKSGEYEKAIEIYLAVLKNVKEPKQRKDLLTLLGKTYYKAGFLRKSEEILLASLKVFPRNEEALTYLIVIYETLREYDKAIEVLDTLEALGANVDDKKIYFKTLHVIHDKSLKADKKIKKLQCLGLDKKIVQRKLFEFLKNNSLAMNSELLKDFDFENIIDLLWMMRYDKFDKKLIESNLFLTELFTAKGEIDDAKASKNFELNILIKLKQQKDKSADLSFSYICNECKHIFPLFFYRCPKCQKIDTVEIETNLIKKSYEKGSFI